MPQWKRSCERLCVHVILPLDDVELAACRDSSHWTVAFKHTTSILCSCAQLTRRLRNWTSITMAFRLLRPALFHLRTPLFAASLGFSGALLIHQTFQSRRLLRLDSSSSPVSPKDWSVSQYQHDASTPVVQESGRLNPRAIRQISTGSILGMRREEGATGK
jgi:hypothetical protein